MAGKTHKSGLSPAFSLRRNISALYVVQIANYLLPLITLPWLTRVLGPEGYGKISFAVATTAYFVMLADYGFNLTATKEIAVHRDNKAKRSEIFWHVLAIKALLAVAGALVLLLLGLIIDKFAASSKLLAIAFVGVFSSVLTPTWYYQGMERLGLLSLMSLGCRLIFLPLIFLFVVRPEDTAIALVITVGGGLLAGIMSLLDIFRRQEVVRSALCLDRMQATLVDGWHLFLSSAAISLYTNTNIVLLGFLAGDRVVGYYAGAEKLIRAAQGLLGPVSQAVYPRISYLMHQSREEAFSLIRWVLVWQGLGTGMVSLALLVAAPFLVPILFGSAFMETTYTLMWLAPLPFLIGLSNVFGIQTMIPMGMKKVFSRILLGSGVVNILLLVPLALHFGSQGAAMAVLVTEATVTMVMAVVLFNKEVPVFGRFSRGGTRAA